MQVAANNTCSLAAAAAGARLISSNDHQLVYNADTPVFPNKTQRASGKQIRPCLSDHHQGSCQSRTAPLEWWWRRSECGLTWDPVPLWPLWGCMTQPWCSDLAAAISGSVFLSHAVLCRSYPDVDMTGQCGIMTRMAVQTSSCRG